MISLIKCSGLRLRTLQDRSKQKKGKNGNLLTFIRIGKYILTISAHIYLIKKSSQEKSSHEFGFHKSILCTEFLFYL